MEPSQIHTEKAVTVTDAETDTGIWIKAMTKIKLA
jgi:hypothetical protein